MEKHMERIFGPATRLMSSLTYARKFFLLGGLSLTALSIVSVTLMSHLSGSIDRSNQQLAGFTQAENISKLIQSLQQRRGLSAADISGIHGSKHKLKGINGSVVDRFLKMTNDLPEEIKKSAFYSDLRAQWIHLKTNNNTIGLKESFSLHTELISSVNALQLKLADHNLLLVTDDPDSYYLTNSFLFTVPIMLETLSQSRGVGVSYLIDQNIESKSRLKALLTSVFIPLGVFKTNIAKVQMQLDSNTNRGTAKVLVSVIERHIKSTVSNVIEKKFLSGKEKNNSYSQDPIEFYNVSTSVIDEGYRFLDTSLHSALNHLLQNRIARLKNQLILSMGLSSMLFVIVLYFIIGLYLSTSRSVSLLTQTIIKLDNGNLGARAHLNADDELNQIAIGLNDMAISMQRLIVDKDEMSTRLRAIIDNSPIGIWFTGLDGHFHFVNKTFTDLVGVKESDFISTPVAQLPQLLGNETAQNCLDSDKAALAQDSPYITYETIPRLNDKPYILEITKVKMKNAQGEVIGLVGISKDITNARQQEEDLKLAEIVYQNSSDAMMVTNLQNEIIAINPALSEITGFSKEELIGQTPKIFSSGMQDSQFYLSMWKELADTGKWQGEIWNKRKNGNPFPEWLTINTIYDNDGNVFRRIALFSDITEKKQAIERILREANYDSLTNLPNRRMFIDRLEQEIRVSKRKQQNFALIFLDLDKFKTINDSKGHNYGDALLVEVGERIVNCVREADTVARIGGDEFTVILTDLGDLHSVELVCQKILTAVSRLFVISGSEMHISASLGVTLYPNDADNSSDLLNNADQAMYLAKELGRNQFCYFTAAMQEEAMEHIQLINDLRKAISLNQLSVHYQPIVDLKTGGALKAEALLRWSHPVRGMVSPTVFIPLAEEAGLILEIGDWVFTQTVQYIKKCKKQLNIDIQISVNKSPLQFKKTGNSLDWLSYLQKSQLVGNNIVIEITEGLLLNNSVDTVNQLSDFRGAGVKLSMDDFGTGYSSLSYLKKFELDFLKIDQSFTKKLAIGSEDMILSEAIITMAQKLGLKVIAEGVETKEQMELLVAAGCDYGQGYLFSRPIPEDKFFEYLAQNVEVEKLIDTRP
jgi:diguanylate cyclase (GGDEF)-like protein/PAS domain S-box-containing protein